jgi:predicted ArsR family transcriptional regulator
VSPDPDIAAVAVLADDLRRWMYAYIRHAEGPVTRDQVAAAAGISRKLAAFHLDKLAAAGLLRTSFTRPAGLHRVGRAPKAYELAGAEVQISIPPRDHGLLAGILLDAVQAVTPRADAAPAGEGGAVIGAREAAFAAAADRGRVLGAAERARARPGRLGAERALTLAGEFLKRSGFEPRRVSAEVTVLRNCPFRPFAGQSPELVCGISQAFLAGFLAGLGTSAAAALLNPQPGLCCVELRSSRAAR